MAWNTFSKQGFKIAADDGKAINGKWWVWVGGTSGGVVVAVANHFTAVVSTTGGKGPEHREGRMAVVGFN